MFAIGMNWKMCGFFMIFLERIWSCLANKNISYSFVTLKSNVEMEIERLKAIVLYVLNAVSGKCLGMHELFKILYFTSQKRLVKYGYALITVFPVKRYGTVTSELFDYLKGGSNAILSSINFGKESLEKEVQKWILLILQWRQTQTIEQ